MKEFNKEECIGQHVVFLLDQQHCALSIKEVVEIIRIQPITEVISERPYVAGVIHLRGSIIPVVHLRLRYRLPVIPFNKKSRIIIIQQDEEKIGLIVDEMVMVTAIEGEQIEPPLEVFHVIEKDAFKGFAKLEDQLIGLLNLHKVLCIEKEEG